MELSSLLPRIVVEHDRDKPWEDWTRGSVLFADVSGFTPMSEALSVLGAEGAEILTDILSRYFADMIGIIHRNSGQVMKFGGDAILCFFPGAGTLQRTLVAARQMQDGMGRFQSIRTPVRKFALKMKIGIAEGDMLLAGVGDPSVRCDFIFAGDPVDLTSDAEHHAKAGDIILASAILPDIPLLQAEPVGPGFFKILSAPGLEDPSDPIPPMPREARRTTKTDIISQSVSIRPYLIREIHEIVASGYHSQVGALLGIVPVFMKFTGFAYARDTFRLDRFHEFFSMVLNLTGRHGGRLNRISMGDKGSTFFILFGAPNSLEKKEQMACQWALDLKKTVGSHFSEVTFGIGMNTGRVFTGVVGGNNRWDYTVMGDAVNLAARLMQAAPAGEILVSDPFMRAASPAYHFQPLGEREFKGKKAPLAVHGLIGRSKESSVALPARELVGRDQEQEALHRGLEDAKQGHPSLTIIEGDPGVGKSALAAAVLARAEQEGWSIVACKGEIARQSQPYTPWRDLAASLFFDGAIPPKRGLSRALKGDTRSALDLDRLLHPQDESSRADDDAAGKKQMQWHHRLSGLVLAAAAGRPTVLFFDDIHAFDSLSAELMLACVRRLDRQPVLLLATARALPPENPLLGMPVVRRLPLREITSVALGILLQQLLEGPARPELVQYVFECTRGNPLFAQELVDGLRHDGYVHQRLGQWMLDSRVAKASGGLTGEAIILAQLNRLSPRQRHLLQFASCLGTSFSHSTLRDAVGKKFSEDDFAVLRERRILHRRDKEDGPGGEDEAAGFGFSHTLFQEAVYGSLLQKVRAHHHRRIAGLLEPGMDGRVLADIASLAHHYFRGGIRSKAVQYGMMAGEQYYAAGSYQEAAHSYGQTYAILGRGRDRQRWNLLARLGQSNLKSGKIRECLDLMNEGLARTASSGHAQAMHTIRLIRCDALQRLGDYAYVEEISAVLHSCPKSAVKRYGPQYRYYLGVAYYRLGRPKDAVTQLGRAAKELAEASPPMAISASLFLSDIWKQSEPQQAAQILTSASEMAKRSSSPDQALRVEMGHTDFLQAQGKAEDAKRIYQALIAAAENMGDYYLLASICLNLGLLDTYSRQFDEADLYLQEAAKIYYKLGVHNGWAKAKMNRGIMFFFREDFQAAYTEYLEATLIFEALAERHETVLGYYNLAETCVSLRRFSEGKQWALKSRALLLVGGDPALLRSIDEILQSLDKTDKN